MKLLMQVRTMLWAMALSMLIMPQTAGAGENAGVRQMAAPSKERGRDLDVTVWYPAKPGGKPVTLGESMFFSGTSAMRDAPIADGKFPLILLSHGAGLGGSAQAMSWIAAPLAKQGFIVAAPTHPGNGGANRSAEETMKLWLRPVDLTSTLDAMEDAPFFKERLNSGAVGVLGLSMGGSTALLIAGARIDPKLLAAYCDTDALNASLCGWIRQSGVDLHAMDFHLAGRDNKDERIRFAMAIDPAPVDVFAPESFSQVAIPVELVNLGQVGKIPVTADASKIAKAIPHAAYATIEDASHYSMFGECKAGAAEIAESEDVGDPICRDGGGRSRRDIHEQLSAMTIAAFSGALSH